MAACWANWLECTTRKRSSSTARRPSVYSTSTWRTTLCPCQRRADSARVRPGFSSNKGKETCCWPQASNSWRTAHVRGTTRARDQGNKPHAFLQAQSQRAFTVGLTVGHNAAYPIEAERHTLLDRYGCLCAITGIAVAQAHAERETLTTHTETQEHLLKIIPPIFAVPIGRPGRERPFARAGHLLIGPIQGDRRRILMQPWGRESIDLQGVERDRTKHAVELRSKQGLQDLPQPIIMERGSREAGLE